MPAVEELLEIIKSILASGQDTRQIVETKKALREDT